jgi:3-hydroxyisobutyrate dehydrogenase-like beta-hydroxyacid dehydrogenase
MKTALFDVASVGGANSGAFQMIMPWVNDRDMKFRFSIANAAKDIGYFSAATEPGAMTRALDRTLREAIDHKLQDLFIPEMTDQVGQDAKP